MSHGAAGRLNNKVALITGAASGIGRATALTFAREGAIVVATDVDETGGSETIARLQAGGGVGADAGCFYRHDVTDEERWREIVASTEARHGRFDILVNNAGIALPGNVTDLSYADWRRQIAVNLDSVFLGSKHAIPSIARSGGGSVINVSSIAGLVGDPGLAGYSASKGGVRLFSKSVALECARARNGVRVNSVHPGIIDTPIWSTNARRRSADGALSSLWRKLYLGIVGLTGVPVGHAGQASDVADAILYLASDESRYVTGTELVVDGGLTAA